MSATASPPPAAIPIPEQSDGIRVVVRPYDPADAPALFAAVQESRERLKAWIPWWDQHRSMDDTTAFCAGAKARWITREDLTTGIFDRAGRLLGGTGLHRIDWKARAFEIGYWIRSGEEGKGYVLEGVAVVTRLAFDTLAANRVEIRCDTRNARSLRIAEALGFVRDGTLRRNYRSNDGSIGDTVVFSMIREEYDRADEAWRRLFSDVAGHAEGRTASTV
jgi:ribosomal-protein-serine acetyltransferase